MQEASDEAGAAETNIATNKEEYTNNRKTYLIVIKPINNLDLCKLVGLFCYKRLSIGSLSSSF